MGSLNATLPGPGRVEESVDHTPAGTHSMTLGPEIPADLQSSNPIRRLISAESLSESSSSTARNRPPSRRTSYIPAIPSPLNPASEAASTICSISSNDEMAAADGGGNTSPIESSSSGDVPRAQRQLGRRNSSNLSPPQAILRQKSASLLRPSTPEAPKRLNDLGRDYSRYPSSSDVRSDSLKFAVTAAPLLQRTTTTNPFNDSQADLEKWGYPDDSVAAFHPYHGGEKGFILYADEIEADDNMHLPRDDDDVVYKAKLSDYLNRRQICSTVGVILLILGLACVFIVLPVLTFTTQLLIPNGGLGHT